MAIISCQDLGARAYEPPRLLNIYIVTARNKWGLAHDRPKYMGLRKYPSRLQLELLNDDHGSVSYIKFYALSISGAYEPPEATKSVQLTIMAYKERRFDPQQNLVQIPHGPYTESTKCG